MQTSVSTTYAAGKEGAIAQADPRHVVTRVVEAAAGIKPGRFVTRGTNPGQVVVPDATGEVSDGGLLQGVSLWVIGREPGGDNGEYEQYDSVPVMKKGLVWMIAEDAVTADSEVFVRFAATPPEELGRVRSDADTADAVAAPGCYFRSSTTGADELVLVEVNLPQ